MLEDENEISLERSISLLRKETLEKKKKKKTSPPLCVNLWSLVKLSLVDTYLRTVLRGNEVTKRRCLANEHTWHSIIFATFVSTYRKIQTIEIYVKSCFL